MAVYKRPWFARCCPQRAGRRPPHYPYSRQMLEAFEAFELFPLDGGGFGEQIGHSRGRSRGANPGTAGGDPSRNGGVGRISRLDSLSPFVRNAIGAF